MVNPYFPPSDNPLNELEIDSNTPSPQGRFDSDLSATDRLEIVPPDPEENRPGKKGALLSFQAGLVSKLKDEISDLRATNRELMETGEENTDYLSRLEDSLLMLMRARSPEEVVGTIVDKLPERMGVDGAGLGIESNEPLFFGRVRRPGFYRLTPGSVQASLKEGDMAFYPELEAPSALFGESQANIKSALFIRLNIAETGHKAVLAFGSQTVGAFHPDQAVDFVAFIAKAVEASLGLWMSSQQVNDGQVELLK